MDRCSIHEVSKGYCVDLPWWVKWTNMNVAAIGIEGSFKLSASPIDIYDGPAVTRQERKIERMRFSGGSICPQVCRFCW